MRGLGPPTTTACGATPPTLRVALGRQELALTSIATIAAVFAPEWAQLFCNRPVARLEDLKPMGDFLAVSAMSASAQKKSRASVIIVSMVGNPKRSGR